MSNRHLLDNLRHGARVVSADGKEVGKLHAVVLDPRDNEVTHVVVNAGPHFPEPGFGAPELIDVPIDEVADAWEEKVELKCTHEQFHNLPSYAERRFTEPIAPGGEKPMPGHTLWNVGLAVSSSLSSLLTGIAVPAERFRKASFERHILHAAPVWRIEPHTHIGDVDRVLVDEETDEIEALVIQRGVLFHEDVVLPFEYVTEVLDGLVHVRITDEEIEGLEPFRAEGAG